jgi:hypothetical protein
MKKEKKTYAKKTPDPKFINEFQLERQQAINDPIKSNEGDEVKPALAHNLTIKKRAMLKALESALGVVTIAAKSVGISRFQHYTWLKDDPEYLREVQMLDEVVLDFAENKLHTLVQNGDVAATIFLLKTKGKKRGFIERSEIELSKVDVKWDETKTYDIPHEDVTNGEIGSAPTAQRRQDEP